MSIWRFLSSAANSIRGGWRTYGSAASGPAAFDSRTDLNAQTAREGTSTVKRVCQRLVTLWHVSPAPARRQRIEHRSDLRGPFGRPRVTVEGNRACQLAHRTSRVAPLRASRLLGEDPRQLGDAHRAPLVATPACWRQSTHASAVALDGILPDCPDGGCEATTRRVSVASEGLVGCVSRMPCRREVGF